MIARPSILTQTQHENAEPAKSGENAARRWRWVRLAMMLSAVVVAIAVFVRRKRSEGEVEGSVRVNNAATSAVALGKSPSSPALEHPSSPALLPVRGEKGAVAGGFAACADTGPSVRRGTETAKSRG